MGYKKLELIFIF